MANVYAFHKTLENDQRPNGRPMFVAEVEVTVTFSGREGEWEVENVELQCDALGCIRGKDENREDWSDWIDTYKDRLPTVLSILFGYKDDDGFLDDLAEEGIYKWYYMI